MEYLADLFMSLFGFYIWIHLAMGVVQPLGAIIRILFAKRQSSPYAIGLKKYLLSVLLYFCILYILRINTSIYSLENLYWIYFFIVPMFFAVWYIHHNYIWWRKHKNIKAYDNLQKLSVPHTDRLLLESYPKKNIHLDNQIFSNKPKTLAAKKTIIKRLPILLLAE